MTIKFPCSFKNLRRWIRFLARHLEIQFRMERQDVTRQTALWNSHLNTRYGVSAPRAATQSSSLLNDSVKFSYNTSVERCGDQKVLRSSAIIFYWVHHVSLLMARKPIIYREVELQLSSLSYKQCKTKMYLNH